MKKVILAALFTSIGSSAFSDDVAIRYETIDVNLSSGGVSVSGDGDGYSISGTFDILDTGFVTTASFASGSGTIAGIDWSLDGTSVGVGYKIIDQINEDSGLQLVAGVGYMSSAGDLTSGGTKYIMGADSTILLGQARAKTGESLSIAGEVILDLEGESDPTFSVGLAYDVTENGSIDLGYSSNNTTSSAGVTSEITGWTVGYRISF